MVLPAGACGLRETARVVTYLADESAGQCGPCRFGLGALAKALAALARGRGGPAALRDLEELPAEISGRGACAHPDGAVRLVRSALSVFPDEVERHRAGYCSATDHVPLLPVPTSGLGRG
jgi:NADH:ubiquinone oxidoreductase subunit F (NADH-binding)